MENFYVLYGKDKSRILYECDKLIKELNTSDIVKYDMKETSLEEVIDDAKTVGMFSNQKIIILEDSFFLTSGKNMDNQECLEEYLEHYNPDNNLIFLVYN